MTTQVDFKVSQNGAYVPPSSQAVLGGPEGTSSMANNVNALQSQQLQASAFPYPGLVLMQQVAQQNMRWELPDGIYQGQIKEGRPHGKGVMTYRLTNDKKYQMYEGEFVEGQMHGKGVMVWQNGDRYNGTFTNNSVTGYGVKENHDGGVYEGNLINGKKEGHGKYNSKDGSTYVGNYKDNQRNGYGVYTWNYLGVESYKGNWEKGEYHGQGELIKKFTTGTEEVSTGIFNNGVLWEGSYVRNGARRTYREGKPYSECCTIL